jgi:DNA anti-recombination protein RmuC
MKAKIDSFKATEDWARKEKEKATRQLEQTTDETERQKSKESVQYFDKMEIQAKRRQKEVVQNQFKRVDAIIKDENRSLGERLRELFRRDGLYQRSFDNYFRHDYFDNSCGCSSS